MCTTNGNGYHFELSEEHLQELQRRADAEGMSLNDYLNKVIADFLRGPENPE
jgi:predicted DNA binding CopG/RHH family protein